MITAPAKLPVHQQTPKAPLLLPTGGQDDPIMTSKSRSLHRLAKAAALLALLTFRVGDSAGDSPATPPAKFRVGKIQTPAIRECSGLIASRQHKGVFWTHNDSGNAASIFAITRDGALIREYPVAAATNTDWEDIALDDAGHLYLADTGNNSGSRPQVQVLRIDEPDPRAPLRGAPAPLRVQTFWRLNYPKKPFDCESLFVLDGKAYLIAKRLNASPAEIFRFDLTPTPRPVTLERVTDLPDVRAPVTAADVSPDGKRLAVLTILGPYLFDIDGDVAKAGTAIPRSSRYIDPHMEAACLVPEGLLAANEGREMFLFRDEHFKPVR
jgi:hypothetical protein